MSRKVRSKEIMSAEQLAEIGSVALESTECEVMVESLIWALAGLDSERGKLFTQSLMMNSRLELLLAVAKSRLTTEEQVTRLTAIVGALKELNTKRNTIIHGSWGAWVTLRELAAIPDTAAPAKAIKRRPNKAPIELSVAELIGTPESIAKATADLRAFAEEAWPRL
mgnify:CR=1 FL=1